MNIKQAEYESALDRLRADIASRDTRLNPGPDDRGGLTCFQRRDTVRAGYVSARMDQ